MGEVDEFGGPVDKHQADGEQAVDQAGHRALRDDLDRYRDGQHHASPLRGEGPALPAWGVNSIGSRHA